MQATSSTVSCSRGDSISEVVDGKPGIYSRSLQEAAEHHAARRGGVGYDFPPSAPRARSEGDALRRERPVSYMRVFDRSCETVNRRGAPRAQMGVLRCDHPDVEEFIHARQGDLANFNISVGVTDRFMPGGRGRRQGRLVHKARPTRIDRGRRSSERRRPLGVRDAGARSSGTRS